MTKNCPDCGSSLGVSAFKCRCGWKSANVTEIRPFVHCAHMGCTHEGMVSVQTKTGWAKLCISSGNHVGHYETQHQSEAIAYAAKHNLKTPADHIAHIKALLKTPKQHSSLAHWQRVQRGSRHAIAQQYAEQMLKRYAIREREPGEDDEVDFSREPMLNV